ncbi:MAG: hypothetical protein AAFX92_03500, partial [Pseudomonadota bacterium]
MLTLNAPFRSSTTDISADARSRFGLRHCAASLLTGVSAAALVLTDEAKAQDFAPWGSGFGATDFETAGAGEEIWIPFAQDADSGTFGF